MLECLNLPDKFRDIASYWRRHNLHRLNNAVGINQKAAPYVNSGFLIIYTVHRPYPPASIRKHGERNASGDHLRKFFLLPNLVGKTAVCAYCQDFYAKFFQFFVFDGNCRQLSWSDKGKIARVKT